MWLCFQTKHIADHNKKIKQNRYSLNIIINCIRFCSSFELILKGHDLMIESSNAGILIDMNTELDTDLKYLLQLSTVLKSTKTIQNKILKVMLYVSW